RSELGKHDFGALSRTAPGAATPYLSRAAREHVKIALLWLRASGRINGSLDSTRRCTTRGGGRGRLRGAHVAGTGRDPARGRGRDPRVDTGPARGPSRARARAARRAAAVHLLVLG